MPWSMLGQPLNEQIEITGESQEPAEIAEVVRNFPDILHRAIIDWARFKAAEPFQLFTVNDSAFIIRWFAELPRLWDTIKINYQTDQDMPFYNMTEKWVAQFRTGQGSVSGLGIIPVIIIAGILIVSAIGGVAAAIWAVGYIQEQSNVTKLIDGVVEGTIPSEVLEAAVAKEESSSPFGGIKDFFQTGLLVVGAILFLQYGLPAVKGLVKAK